MPWTLLLDLRVLLGIALVAVGAYAKVQTVRLEQAKAEFVQFRADVESEAAKAKVMAAQEATRQALNAQEAIDDLSTRNTNLSARYERLRHAIAGSGAVPSLSSAAQSLGTCRGEPGQPDPAIGLLDSLEERILAVLAEGDREIAKLVELYRLEQANAAR